MHSQIKKTILTSILSTILLLFGSLCYAEKPALSENIYKSINNTKAYHFLEQNRIRVKVPGYPFGENPKKMVEGVSELIAMELIGQQSIPVRRNIARQKVAFFVDTLKHYEFRKKFHTKLAEMFKRAITDQGLFDIKLFELKTKPGERYLKNANSLGKGTLLVLETRYHFNESFRNIMVDTAINFQDKAQFEKGEEEFLDGGEAGDFREPPVIFRSRVIYQSKSMPLGLDYQKYWGSENRLKKALDEGLEILPEMIVANLTNSLKPEAEGVSGYWEVTIDSNPIKVVSGGLIHSKGDRVFVKVDRKDADIYVSLDKGSRISNAKVEALAEVEEEF